MEMWCGQHPMCVPQQCIIAMILIVHSIIVELSHDIAQILVNGRIQTTLSAFLYQEPNLLFIYTSPFTPIVMFTSETTYNTSLDQYVLI